VTIRAKKLTIYTVVEVWRGIAQGAKNFKRLRDAKNHMQQVRVRQNPMEDEVALFKGSLRA
jgi:hypothetical protein